MKIHILIVGLMINSLLNAQSIRVEDIPGIISRLTLEEKIKIVVGKGMNLPGFSVGDTTFPDKVPGAAGHSYPFANHSLPMVVFSDGPAGIRIDPTRADEPNKTYYATAFPIASLISASWDQMLMQKVGEAFGEEAREYGVDILLAPALNIQRNPLGGRNFEYYSEDPLLSGKMAAAFVRGIQSQGVGASIKHFAANNQESSRVKLDVKITERAMREIYLKGFEIAVKESEPWTVMSSYNKINGVYTSQRYDLLTTILRNEWGFKGFVMTDWFSGDNAVEQLIAGNDMLMPGMPKQQEELKAAINNGSLSEEVLNRSVERILTIYVKTPSFKTYKYSNSPSLTEHNTISREVAAQGMVLLKNKKNVLPVPDTSLIALFGVTSFETIIGGTGSGYVNSASNISIYKGLVNASCLLDETLITVQTEYIASERSKIPPKKLYFEPDILVNEMLWTQDLIDSAAAKNGIAIYVLGRSSGEMQDRKLENDFELSTSESELIRKLSEAFHSRGKKIVVLLNIGGVIETASWKDLVDGILLVWQPGQEAGNAVADILTGMVNPSGKLPTSFPVNYSDLSSATNFPGKEFEVDKEPTTPFEKFLGKPAEVVYQEDIFVGYRYFETFKVPVSFPFGFGLSYTQFTYSDLIIERISEGQFNVSWLVKNIGWRAGQEVVQLYVSAPKTKLDKPEKELKAFAKTRLLRPGEEELVQFTLTTNDLASFHEKESAWIVEKGNYSIKAAASVNNINLSGSIAINKEQIVSKTTRAFAPVEEIETLTIPEK